MILSFVSFTFVMLLCIIKFLHYAIIKYMFCFYPYTNVNQPNPGTTSTICTRFYNTFNRENRLHIFLTDSKW